MLNVLSKPVDRRSIVILGRLIAAMQRFARSEAFDERAMLEIDSEVIGFRAASESFFDCRRPGGQIVGIGVGTR